MGKQQTKFSSLRRSFLIVLMAFSCLLLAYGYCLLDVRANLQCETKNVQAQDAGSQDLFWGKDIKQDNIVRSGNKIYIDRAGGLAYFNYLLTNSAESSSTEDYSNYTVVLNNDIDLSITLGNGDAINPLWMPIEIGDYGKHRNITFDGAGFSISGLHIKYTITDEETPRNVGFFAEMYGGVFKNVTFKNPIIDYEYQGESLAANDENRLDAPNEIGVGVIAGVADSTYIENVTIENPTINVTTDNLNGHNFYVGSAVGKMNFTANMVKEDGDEVRKSINTVTPTQWGINTVNVIKTDNVSTGLNFTVNEGNAAGTEYGVAFNAYVGGLVGANVNSKVVNSTLKNVTVNPVCTPVNPENEMAGSYFVGGLVGLSTQITSSYRLIVASGLYNNLLLNVNLNDISDATNTENTYCGNLVGRVYSGGWIYNNMVIGEMPYGVLWGQVYNSLLRYVTDDCIGTYVGGINDYYLNSSNESYSDCKCRSGYYNPYKDSYEEEFVYCGEHGTNFYQILTSREDSGAVEVMEEYNFYYASTDDPAFTAFVEDGEQIDGVWKSNFELMNYFRDENGFLYHAIKPIIDYEVGLTINEKNPETGDDATDMEKMVDAIYQFRSWKYDEVKKEPVIADFTGLDYKVTFKSNSPADSRAYWVVNNNGYNEEVSEFQNGRTYQKIYQPETPTCEGYEFKGWKIEGLEQRSTENESSWDAYSAKGFIDEDGYYQFGIEELLEPDRSFVAIWNKKEFNVKFVVREEGVLDKDHYSYNIFYGNTLSKPEDPVSTQGYKFVGWFLEEDLPEDGEDADVNRQWVFGAEGTKMPGRDIVLYSGWVDNINMLRGLIAEGSLYHSYFVNYKIYFEDAVGQAYYDAFDAALAAKESTENLQVPVPTLLENLENAFAALKVDPNKLLNLPAFDESRIENICPFLYKDDARMRYQTFKQTVKQYIYSNETDRTNIDAYIKNYENMTNLFESLKLDENLNSSVKDAGGIDSDQVKNLVEKYLTLQTKSNALDKDKYSNETLMNLEVAEAQLNKLWNAESGDQNLREIELAVDAYEAAIANLKPASAVNPEQPGDDSLTENTGNGAPQLPISPMLMGIIVVLVLVAGVGGYIGFDIMKNKNLLLKSAKNVNQYNEVIEEDDEGYF